MSVILNRYEVSSLRTALDRYLPELEAELSRVTSPVERGELIELEQGLRALRDRLDEPEPPIHVKGLS